MGNLEIKSTKNKGKGVFSKKEFKKEDIIEKCELIKIPRNEIGLIKKTILNNYYFILQDNSGAIALGNGSLYNHSYKPNAKYEIKNDKLIISAIKNIQKNVEITINYNGKIKDKSKMWFDAI